MCLYTELARGAAVALQMESFYLRARVLHLAAGESKVFQAHGHAIVLRPEPPYTGGHLRVRSDSGVFHPSDPAIGSNTLDHTGRVEMENTSAVESTRVMALFIYPHKQTGHEKEPARQ